MAEVTLNPIISSISGRLGGIVFFTSRGRQYARRYVSPVNQDTDAQRKRRSLFAAAVKSWQGLPAGERKKMDYMAGAFGTSGYHLYISRYMKAKPAGEGLSHGGKSLLTCHKAFSIVIDPVPLRFTFNTAPQQTWRIIVIASVLFQPLLLYGKFRCCKQFSQLFISHSTFAWKHVLSASMKVALVYGTIPGEPVYFFKLNDKGEAEKTAGV